MNIRKLAFIGLLAISSVAFSQTFTVNNLQVNGTTTMTNPLTIANGGTGANTQSAALTALLGSSLIPIANGGTNANSAANARTNLAVPGLGTANTFTVSPQTVATASGTAALVVQGVAGTSRELDFQTGSNLRWKFQASNAAESGSNVGSDLAVGRYNDAGTFVDNPFVITRSTGLTTIGILTVSGAFTPSQTNGIVGTTTNNNANAGSVGEYTTATNTATSLTTATAANCTSVSLTAGDWDVQSVIMFTPTGTTSLTDALAGVSTVSATGGALGTYTKNTWAASVLNNNVVISSPIVRVSIAGTTTVYAIGRSTFTASTLTCDGFIRARRVR